MLPRNSLNALKTWKSSQNRKPLILLGARQVGKTTLIQNFGSRNFRKIHEINFEERRDLHSIFDKNLSVDRLLKELAYSLGADIDIANDLLFFDEVQLCPLALTSLKYFYERLPELAVVAAGSLLGLGLGDESFPVGKVDRLELHPLSFEEFLIASNETALNNNFKEFLSNSEIPLGIHDKVWNYFKLYLLSGGLPDVVTTALKADLQRADQRQEIRSRQKSIIKDYLADIAKHSGKVNAMHIERVFSSSAEQLAQVQDNSSSRFRFRGVVPGISQYSRLASAFDWLEMAGLIIKVPVISEIAGPLSSNIKESFFKSFIFDVGILGALVNLAPEQILNYNYGSYKGFFAENLVAQELKAHEFLPLFSWQHGESEIEFLIESAGNIVPLEVKAGVRTRSQSLNSYQKKHSPGKSFIISAKAQLANCVNRQNPKMLPLYAMQHLREVLAAE